MSRSVPVPDVSQMVISEAPDASPALAVIVAVPSATAVTRPEASTVAIAASLDAHENSALATAYPLASNAKASSRSVSPSAVMVAFGGPTTTDDTVCVTVTAVDPEADPAVAIIVATPLPAAVTKPTASTTATPGALLVQTTVTPGMTRAFWSRTSAASVTVASNAVSSPVAGVTVIAAGKADSGVGSPVEPSPHPLPKATAGNAASSRMMVR